MTMKLTPILAIAVLTLFGTSALAQNTNSNTSVNGTSSTGIGTSNPSVRTNTNNNTNTGTTTGQTTPPPNTATGGLPSATDNNLLPNPRPGTGK